MSFKKFILNYFVEFLLALFVLVATIDNIRNLIIFQNTDSFMFGSILIFFVLLLYLWIWFSHRSKRLKLNLIFDDEVNEFGVVINKIVVPVLLYISLVYYAYYNLTTGMLNIVYLVFFFAFYIYFVNVKAFFRRELNREHRTDVVYDVFKFMIFFLSVDVVANLTRDFSLEKIVAAVIVFLITFALVSLAIFRLERVKRVYFTWNLPIALIISTLFFLLISFTSMSFVVLSFLMLLVYYSLVALLFHKIHGTLSASVVSEYVAVTVLCLAILAFL